MSSKINLEPTHTRFGAQFPEQFPEQFSEQFVDQCVAVIGRVREQQPRVHCVTNNVVLEFTANGLLAVGAIPSMTIDPSEVGEFASSAASLLINLGTLDAERRQAVQLAIRAVRHAHKPWVMDPVMIERSAGRLEYARSLIANAPTVVRGNRSELDALQLPNNGESVRACTGEIDSITGQHRRVEVAAGHPLMAQVTGVGCVTSALVAAACAVEADATIAASAALLLIGAAGKRAGERARGSGSFRVELLDELNAIDSKTLAEIGHQTLTITG